MRNSLLKQLGVVTVLTLSAQASAVGLGGINVTSALGQNLKAEVQLLDVGKAEKTSLVARLASPETYKAMGLEYPTGIKIKFDIEKHADGASYLRVSSSQPLNDPFVTLLVELAWSTGRVLREYTFLLDPPGYVPELPKPTNVQAVAPVVQSPAPVAAKPVSRPAPVAASPIGKPAAAKPSGPSAATSHPAAAQKTASAVPAKPAAKSVTVKRGDTLSRISERNKPAEVSLERMLVALYRANAAEFDDHNMNRIQVGKVLRLPTRDEIKHVTQQAALVEIRAQAADWNDYRQRLASSVPGGRTEPAARQAVTGKVTSSIADNTPVVKESAKEVLKLSRGEASGDQIAPEASTGGAGQAVKNAAQEDAITSAKTASEEQQRAALLAKNIKDAQRLAALKAGEESPASPVTKVSATTVPATPTLAEQIMSKPAYLVGIAAVALGLGGLGFLWSSGRQTGTRKTAVAMATATGSAPKPPGPVEKTDYRAEKADDTAEAIRQLEHQDPLNEADLLLNFGRDAQAEEVLKDALREQPDGTQIKLRLLGIYAKRRDAEAFAEMARLLRGSGDQEAWQQASAMGRELEPHNPLYGGSGAMPEVAPVEAEDVARADSAGGESEAESRLPATQAADDILAGINLDLGESATPVPTGDESRDDRWHEVATKLDLAKAYQEMGDVSGAREILAEVLQEGDAGQREAAQSLLDQLA